MDLLPTVGCKERSGNCVCQSSEIKAGRLLQVPESSLRNDNMLGMSTTDAWATQMLGKGDGWAEAVCGKSHGRCSETYCKCSHYQQQQQHCTKSGLISVPIARYHFRNQMAATRLYADVVIQCAMCVEKTLAKVTRWSFWESCWLVWLISIQQSPTLIFASISVIGLVANATNATSAICTRQTQRMNWSSAHQPGLATSICKRIPKQRIRQTVSELGPNLPLTNWKNTSKPVCCGAWRKDSSW